MELTLSKLLRVLLPSICIFYTISKTASDPLAVYRQQFGNNDYYLDLYFPINPKGTFQVSRSEGKARFKGYFVTTTEEEEVAGFLERRSGEHFYIFQSQRGQFLGKLDQDGKGCGGGLRFEIRGRKPIPTQWMKAGFCL